MSEKMQYVKSGIFSYSGKLITILSSLVYTFLIANFLGPANYGLVSYYISFTLGLIGMFGIYYFGGIVGVFMPKWKSRRFFKYNFVGVFVISLLLFLGLYMFSEEIVFRLGRSNYELLQITSFLLLVIPFTLFYTWIFSSFKMFGKNLKFNLIVAVLNLSLAFLLVVILGYGLFGVVYAMIFSNICGLVFLAYHLKYLTFLDNPIDFSEIKKYSIFGIPATFLNRVENQILLVFMGLFIIDEELGMYYIALKIVSVVVATPINSLTEVLLPYLSESSNDKRKISRYFSLNIKFSLIVTLILSVLVILFSKYVLMFLFPEYVGAYLFVVALTVLFVISSLDPLHSLFVSLNRMDIIARSKLASLMSTIVFGLLFIPLFSVFGLIVTQTLSVLVCRVMLIYYLKSIDISVEIIPRKRDVVYFCSSLNKLMLAVFGRMRR